MLQDVQDGSEQEMSEREEDAYVLGTSMPELQRLGIQHQVWTSETVSAWETAGFAAGQTLLDLGCGPGFCTTELAYIVGAKGKVIGVDRSAAFIEFLEAVKTHHSLNIELQCAEFDDMQLADNSLDGAYVRWALAWVPNPEEVVARVTRAMKPGGVFVAHEYFDWSTYQVEPQKPALTKAIDAALKSFKDQPGEIDIGRELPAMLARNGFDVTTTRSLSKLARPHELTWQWPSVFLRTYVASLADNDSALSTDTMNDALRELEELESIPESMMLCPQVIEVIARKR
jgi:ubiquinone/menaquinone biosynthesis C-methylase UbiE